MPPPTTFPFFSALLRRPPPPPQTPRAAFVAARAHSTFGASQARGGLPRFHSPSLPSSKASTPISLAKYLCGHFIEQFVRISVLPGSVLVAALFGVFVEKTMYIASTVVAFLYAFYSSGGVRSCTLTLDCKSCGYYQFTMQGEMVRIQGDEFWHMTRVLRLRVNDRIELFDGAGGLAEGSIQKVDKSGSDVVVLEDPKLVAPQGIQWHVYAAFGTLKGGRADWLIEKCTELGACSVTPLLTERCHTIAENRVDRLQRLVLAAVKQCQRIHEMLLKPPMQIRNLPPIVSQSKLAFLASAKAPPLFNLLPKSSCEESGLLIIGPEGDFTEEELKLLKVAGATPVGLGPCRLRVETATISLLSALMLWSDAQH